VLVVFVFNIGNGSFAASTLLKKLNAGDYNGAADELLRLAHASG
jgi:lysozyme